MVAPSATARESEKKGMSRFAFNEPSSGSQTTRQGAPVPNTRSPSSSETSVKPSSRCSSRWTTAVSAAASMAVVSSPPTPVWRTGSRSTRVGSSDSTTLMSPTASRQTSSQGLTGSTSKWVEEQAGDQLREEVRRLLRQHLAAARSREDVIDPRRLQQIRDRGLAVTDATLGLGGVGRVRDPVVAERVDELDVEHPRRHADAAALLAGQLRDRGTAAVAAFEVLRCREEPVRGEDLE